MIKYHNSVNCAIIFMKCNIAPENGEIILNQMNNLINN